MRNLRLALMLIALLGGSLAHAVQPDEVLANAALEARARELSAELRCLVCQNQSIDDSDATLAKDIRVLIRERLVQGASNAAVREFLVSRYGDFILLKPPFKPQTLLLWFGAPLTLAIGAFAIARAVSRRRTAAPAPLSAEEEARLAAIGKGESGNSAG